MTLILVIVLLLEEIENLDGEKNDYSDNIRGNSRKKCQNQMKFTKRRSDLQAIINRKTKEEERRIRTRIEE